ncbi:metal ABC transporter permease, partial [Escherichia coli]|uniref:metal ABC transporter permease n=1 Tax=Escherichia coli TaxID=562 RepID=UPI001D15D734
HTNRPLTDFGGKTSIFSHPVYLFLREFSLQDFRGGSRCLHYGLLCMVSLTIVATLKAVGIILSISLLIAPGAIAVLLTQRFHIALLLAIGISVIVSMTGVWLSFFIDSAPAPTIVVLFAVVFIMTFTVTSINARTKGNTHTQDLSSPN